MEEDTEMQEIMNKTPNFEEQENRTLSRKHRRNCSQRCMILLIVVLVLSLLLPALAGLGVYAAFWVLANSFS